MAQEFDLNEGIDPTPLSQVGASELLQLVKEALPKANRWMGIFSPDEPDIISNPHLVRYLWTDTSIAPPYTIKQYNPDSAAWEAFTLGPNTVGTAQLQNNSVSIGKIIPGTPTWFLITDIGGGVTWADINQAISDDKLEVLKLQKSVVPGQLLRSAPDNTGTKWFTLNAADFIADFGLLINKLNTVEASAGQSIRTKDPVSGGWEFFTPVSAGDPLLNNSVQLIKLEQAPAEFYQIRANNAKDAVWFAPLITSVYKTADVALVAFPAAALGVTNPVVFPHGLAVVPAEFNFKMVVQAPYVGYLVGEELRLESISNGNENNPVFSMYADTTNIYLLREGGSATDIKMINKTTGAAFNPSDANLVTNFKIRGFAAKYTQIA